MLSALYAEVVFCTMFARFSTSYLVGISTSSRSFTCC